MAIRRLALAAIVLLAGGCDRRSASSSSGIGDQAISHRVEEGPVRASITLAPREVRTSGSVELIVAVTVPSETMIENLKLEEALPADWVITDRRRSTASVGATQRTERFEFTVEPFLPGHHEIGSFEIVCNLDGDAGGRVVLHSIPVPVEVVSEWPAGESAGEPAALRGVVDPPAASWPWWAWTGLGGAVVLAVALAAWLMARSKRPFVPEPIRKPAHEIALADLGRLIADQLIERGAYRQFYPRISGILRRYLENRFALRAPEQTTEEFLEASRSARCFNAGDLELLEEFLMHCDMVKFAEQVPDITQMNGTLESVRAFIERTRSEEAMVELPARTGDGRRRVELASGGRP